MQQWVLHVYMWCFAQAATPAPVIAQALPLQAKLLLAYYLSKALCHAALRCAVPCRAVQVPNLDAAVSTKTSIKQRGILKSLRMLLAGLTDMGRTAVGLPAIYLPLAGGQRVFCCLLGFHTECRLAGWLAVRPVCFAFPATCVGV